MKQASKNKLRYESTVRALAIIGILSSVVCLMVFGVNVTKEQKGPSPSPVILVKKDSIASLKAFKQVYMVLMSPRCMNCHPSGEIPLQGEDSQIHTMAPRRGIDGKGVYAMKCSNCHQPTNSPGLHTPPGNANWHLPPADMKMIFQGRNQNQLAKQLIDPMQNGHKDLNKLIAHADDGLVLAGWNPGEGRKLPPMSHAAFKKAWITWLTTGAYAPNGK